MPNPTLYERYYADLRKCFTRDRIIHYIIVAIVIGVFAYFYAMREEQKRQDTIKKALQMNELLNPSR
ncbi:MAG: hypothetical protein PHH57_05825 [Candidatus Omnitrophica bacterium]|nr:hypothetical protein [Candidatus Omnitrophota bacterium]